MKFSFGFQNYLDVDCEDKSGRITIMWKDKVDFKGLSYSKNHVHGVFCSRIVERDFFLTGVYGPPDVSNRPSF